MSIILSLIASSSVIASETLYISVKDLDNPNESFKVYVDQNFSTYRLVINNKSESFEYFTYNGILEKNKTPIYHFYFCKMIKVSNEVFVSKTLKQTNKSNIQIEFDYFKEILLPNLNMTELLMPFLPFY